MTRSICNETSRDELCGDHLLRPRKVHEKVSHDEILGDETVGREMPDFGKEILCGRLWSGSLS